MLLKDLELAAKRKNRPLVDTIVSRQQDRVRYLESLLKTEQEDLEAMFELQDQFIQGNFT